MTLQERIDVLIARINDGFPVVSSGADDPMIDGLGALSELEDVVADLLLERDQLEKWLRFYAEDDVDVDYMLRNFRNPIGPAA